MVNPRLVAYAPNGPALGVLPWPAEWSATAPLDELGAATLTYAQTAPGADPLGRSLAAGLEVAVEEWTGTTWAEPRNSRYISIEREFDIADPSGTVTLTMPGYGFVLSKIKHAAPNESYYAADGDNEGRRLFLGVTAGTIVATLLGEYTTRGGPAIVKDFTTATDSLGTAWPTNPAFWVSRGEALDVTLDRLTASGLAWWFEGRTLRMATQSPSRDRATTVMLRTGREIAAAPSKETIADLISAHTTHGGDGLLITDVDATAPTPWGRWEGFGSDDRITTAAGAHARNQQLLADAGRVRGQYTRDLTPLCEHVLGVDIMPGDWISAPTVVARETVRVAALLWRADTQGVTRALILHDSLLNAELKRSRRERLGEGGLAGGGTTVKPAGPDKRTPAQVTGLALSTTAYLDSDGRARGLVTATWVGVTTATAADGGGALEVASYDVATRPNTSTPWTIRSAESTSFELGGLNSGSQLQVQVRARGRYATTPGVWSSTASITVASDATPPPVPTPLTLSSQNAVVTAVWDGLGAGNVGMPADFSHTLVYVGLTSTPTVAVDRLTGPGSIQIVAERGQTVFVRAKTVDKSGNMSTYCAVRQILVRGVLDDTGLDERLASIDGATDSERARVDQVILDLGLVSDGVDTALTGGVSVDRLVVTGGATMPVAVIDDLVAQNAFASAVYAGRVIVAANNLLPDPLMRNPNAWSNSILWSGTGGKTGGGSLQIPASATQSGAYCSTPANVATWAVRVEPGKKYLIGAWVKTTPAHASGTGNVAIYARGHDETGTQTMAPSAVGASPGAAANTWVWMEGVTPSMPAGTTRLCIGFYTQAAFNAAAVFSDPVVKEQVGGELIVDGAITGKHLFFDEAFGNKLKAGFAEFDTVLVGAMDGKVITGALVQTAIQPNKGIKLTADSQLLIYDSDGNLDGRLASTPGAQGAQFWLQSLKLGTLGSVGEGDRQNQDALFIERISGIKTTSLHLGENRSQLRFQESEWPNPAYRESVVTVDRDTVVLSAQDGAYGAQIIAHRNYVRLETAVSGFSDDTYLTLDRNALLRLNGPAPTLRIVGSGEPGLDMVRTGTGTGAYTYLTSSTAGEIGIRLRPAWNSSDGQAFWYLSSNGRMRSVVDGVTRDHPFATYTGTAALSPAAANTQYSTTITFPTGRFTKTPVITLTPTSTNSTQRFCTILNASATGFTLQYQSTSASNFTCHIIAIQDSP